MSNRANINLQLFIAIFGLAMFVISGCPGGVSVKGPDVVIGLSTEPGNKLVTLNWDEVELAETYNIYFSMNPGVGLEDEKISGITDLSYEHTGLINGATYYYIITAQSKDGESETSDEVIALPMYENDFSGILVSPEIQKEDIFGINIDIDGNYAIIGAPGEDGGSGDPTPLSGAAYIFHRDEQGDWDQGARLEATDPQQNDLFGYSVSIHGAYAVVGAYMESGGSGDLIPKAGAVYVYRRIDAHTWDTGVKLVAPDTQTGDIFGKAVSIHSDYILVGASGEDGGSGDTMNNAGAAYVFRRIGANSWDNGVRLEAPDAQEYDQFGYSVSIHGEQAVMGAIYEDGGSADPLLNAGAAYVFERIGENSWSSVFRLVAPDPQTNDSFGWSVSMSGNRVIVGAPREDGGDGDPRTDAGAAYLFEKNEGDIWESRGRFSAGDSEMEASQFGFSVNIDGDLVVVGSPYEDFDDDDLNEDVGAAYVFYKNSAGDWEEVVKLTAGEDSQSGDQFGYSVSITESYIIVGAPAEDGGSGDPSIEAGAVYVF